MTIDQHLTEFFGKPVKDFTPGEPFDAQAFAPRIAVNSDDYFGGDSKKAPNTWGGLLDLWLASPGAAGSTHLVAGAYEGFEGDMDAKMAIEPLARRGADLSALEALFLGDITFEQCELSWIQQQDLSPLWEALPGLRALGLRGYLQTLGAESLPRLESLTLQSSGLSQAALAQILALEAPALTHLELWTGSENYGAETEVEDLQPLFSGGIFPKLTHLALRDSEYADAIAKAIVQAPLFARLEILDLSLGTLGEEGGEALLAALPGSGLKRLILDHHFMSEALTAKFAAFGARVSLADRMQEDDRDRYVAVSE